MSTLRERTVALGSAVELGERLGMPMVEADLTGVISEANRAAARLYGLDVTELPGRPIACGACSANVSAASRLLADAKVVGGWEGTFDVTGGADQRPVDVRATLLCDDDGQPVGVALAFHVPSESSSAGIGPLPSEAKLRVAQRAAGVGVWEWDPMADQLFVSEAFTALLGLDAGVVPRMSDALAAILPEDREQVTVNIDQAMFGGCDSFVNQYRIRGADGELLWLEACCEVRRDEQGRLVRLYGVTQDVTERVRTGERLRQAEEFWRATLDSLSSHVAVLDELGVIVAVNQAWRRFAEREGGDGDYVGANYLEICDRSGDELAHRAAEGLREVLSGRSELFVLEYPCHGPAARRWFSLRASPHVGSGGIRAVVSHTDITDRRDQQEHSYLQAALLDEVDVAVVVADPDGRVRTWNAGAERLFGWSAEEALGQRTGEFLAVNGDSRMPQARSSPTGRWEGETRYVRKDGSSFPAYIRTRRIPSLDGQDFAVVGVVIDVTEQRESERQLKLARDYLRALTDSIGEGMYTEDNDGRITYMNPAAEQQLGWSLNEIRGSAMHEISHSRRADGSAYAPDQCPIIQARRVGKRVKVDDEIFVRKDGSELPVAYTATPLVTQSGVEGCVVVFEDITERKARDQRIERDLEKLARIRQIRAALAEDRFVLHAQPIIDVHSGRQVQRELLIRMREPGADRLLPPSDFLPVAEELGFITDIDRWVITRAAEIAASGAPVELNISAASLEQPGLIRFIQETIARAGADPRQIVFEITETAVVNDEATARRLVLALKEMGCQVALDDFGTGYGGFTYLKHLPIDYLKIDIEFVRDLVDSPASRSVVQAIVGLAAGFELKTVAEGVEDEPTLGLLRELGVNFAQGYHIGRPAPLNG